MWFNTIFLISNPDNLIFVSRVFGFFVLIFGVLMFLGIIYKNVKKGKKDLLDKMLKNNDITSEVYVKYLNEDN